MLLAYTNIRHIACLLNPNYRWPLFAKPAKAPANRKRHYSYQLKSPQQPLTTQSAEQKRTDTLEYQVAASTA